MGSSYNLQEINPQKVAFNKDNPRGESEQEIKSDKEFEQLKDSVAQFGVLVPIVVHKRKFEDGKEYILVDGERRLRAALATRRATVPAHIASSEDKMGELIQAFHIHMLRKQWKPVATARALKRIKTELKQKKSSISEEDLLKELQIRTGCSNSQLQDLQRGIKYSDSVLKDVVEDRLKWSHLVQFEASFVEQLHQHYPKLLQRLGARHVRDVLVEKALNKIIGSTRTLMENILPVIARSKTGAEKDYAMTLFEEFINNKNMAAEELKKRFDKKYPPSQDIIELADQIIDNIELLNMQLNQLEITQLVGFCQKTNKFKKSLQELNSTINKNIRQLNKYMGQ